MFAIEIPCFDLNLVYQGNQAYRWVKVNEDKYIIINGSNITLIQQKRNKKALLCSEDDFYDKWYNYLDINFDYAEALFDVKMFSKEVNQKCFLTSFILRQNRKLRILRTDLFETMIYYLLNDDVDYYGERPYKDRRKNPNENKIDAICRMFGKKRHNTLDGISINWYEFPSPNEINSNIAKITTLKQDEVNRIKHVVLYLRKNESILNQIEASENYDEVYELLNEIYDDSTWIKNVMFYSLGFKEAFAIRPRNKRTFASLCLSPNDFKTHDHIKGLLLEYLKVNENMSTLSRWNKEWV